MADEKDKAADPANEEHHPHPAKVGVKDEEQPEEETSDHDANFDGNRAAGDRNAVGE